MPTSSAAPKRLSDGDRLCPETGEKRAVRCARAAATHGRRPKKRVSCPPGMRAGLQELRHPQRPRRQIAQQAVLAKNDGKVQVGQVAGCADGAGVVNGSLGAGNGRGARQPDPATPRRTGEVGANGVCCGHVERAVWRRHEPRHADEVSPPVLRPKDGHVALVWRRGGGENPAVRSCLGRRAAGSWVSKRAALLGHSRHMPQRVSRGATGRGSSGAPVTHF